MKTIKKNLTNPNSTQIDLYLSVMLLIMLPVFFIIITSLSLRLIGTSNNSYLFVLQTGFSMVTSFVVIPYFYARRINRFTLKDLGLMRLTITELVIIPISIITMYVYVFNFSDIDNTTLVILSLQTLFVAFSEEFWARGLMYYFINKIFKKPIVVVLTTSIVFAFVTHSSRSFLENLIFRLPCSIFITFLYYKTKRLSYPIAFHFIYNILAY